MGYEIYLGQLQGLKTQPEEIEELEIGKKHESHIRINLSTRMMKNNLLLMESVLEYEICAENRNLEACAEKIKVRKFADV
ncbi:hypothetical protein SLEP1_g42433 [Rubroshorea leprosula]|uniref:Uncharacterized protein n=1 Tax=Rubroshorea leprosula TaxID=152421 RepID=A0AAV5LA82_9ROSI|nr:hypothetical protein SLEP1_g42433 [Rubroshorea leprosula]